jgi:hypothetical protein
MPSARDRRALLAGKVQRQPGTPSHRLFRQPQVEDTDPRPVAARGEQRAPGRSPDSIAGRGAIPRVTASHCAGRHQGPFGKRTIIMPNGLRCYGPHMMRPWLAWPKRRSATRPGHRADVDDRRDISPGGAVCGHGVRHHELRAAVGRPEAGQRRAGLPGEGGQLIQYLRLAGARFCDQALRRPESVVDQPDRILGIRPGPSYSPPARAGRRQSR